MANISITLLCNRDCSYCFARTVQETYKNKFMSVEIFRDILYVLKNSGIKHVRLLGGEPTLHPQIKLFIKEAIEKEFQVLLFSNGLIGEEVLHYLKKTGEGKAGLLININSPKVQSDRENELQRKTFEAIGKRITPGFNINSPVPDFDFLIDLIETYGLNKSIRLGLAHPCQGTGNTFINPKDYIQTGHIISEFAVKAEKYGINLKFDCGFVPCMFPEGFLERFYSHPVPFGMHCGPMPDILPDGGVISCYSLANVRKIPFNKKLTINDYQKALFQSLKPYRFPGVFKRCKSCRWFKSGQCCGGCMSAAMNRLRSYQ